MNPTVLFSLILLEITAISPKVLGTESLRQLSSCSCEVGNNRVVDLSPLGYSNKTPRFKDVMSELQVRYSWNPCYDFHEKTCEGVAGCQSTTNFLSTRYYSLGSQNSAKFAWSPAGELQIIYHKPGARKLYVTLMCTEPHEKDKLVAVGERPFEQLVYDLTLYSHHACAREGRALSSSVSVGTIILITFLVTIFVYIVAGVSVQVFIFKASGLKAIPNVEFWTKIPGLVKDGCVFTIRRGKMSEGYQPMS